MYQKTRVKLTFIYSFLFFILFWALSFGIFLWMRESLYERYISQVKTAHEREPKEIFDKADEKIASIAGSVAISQLGVILLTINGAFFVFIPLLSYYLTGKTLHPVKQSYDQQKQFVSDASHEMRTPLSIMSGEMELALKRQRTVQEYQAILRSSLEEINRLSTLINNLLFLARGNAPKQKIRMEHVDITDLISSVVHLYHPKMKEKGLHIHFTPAEKSLVVIGHAYMLHTVFSNLLDNAIKYTPMKGKIWISISAVSSMVKVSIRDNGIGISGTDTDKIFDRFYRVDTSRSNPKGYGLGLSIAKSIIIRHHGKIEVLSTPFKGSTFIVYLPQV
jgi:two-component system, OmpR family, sensor histidine kinase CiaH